MHYLSFDFSYKLARIVNVDGFKPVIDFLEFLLVFNFLLTVSLVGKLKCH